MRSSGIIVCILIFTLRISESVSQDSIPALPVIELRGYVKDLQGVFFVNDLSDLTSSNLLHHRLNAQFNISPSITGRLEFRNRIFWGDQIAATPGFAHIIDQYNGLLDLSVLWLDEKNMIGHTVIDRMLLQYAKDDWDIRIGRQRINWGINTVWNPNDLFNAFNILDFDYEERPGNDAVRVQYFRDNGHAVEVAVKPGNHEDETIAAGLYKFNAAQYDFQVLGGVYHADYVLGAGWAGHIGQAGFKGEASYFLPRRHAQDTSGVLSMSVMADLTFKGEWYCSASILYNSHPAGYSIPGGGILSADLSPKNLYPYRYSGYVQAAKNLSPITSLSMSVIYSPTDHSLLLFPAFSWNVANNFDVGIFIQSSFAKFPDRFKTQGNAVFIRTKWSY